MSTSRCILTRRNSDDVKFIRFLWGVPEFINSFHPMVNKLPDSDKELIATLDREYKARIDHSTSLHWVIRDKKLEPRGLLSLCDISIKHRRAEILLGVLPDSPYGLSVSAMLMVFLFYFKSIKFNKLYSLVFSDNKRSINSTMAIGGCQEGFFRGHMFDDKVGSYRDVLQFGWLESDAFSERNQRLSRRLFV